MNQDNIFIPMQKVSILMDESATGQKKILFQSRIEDIDDKYMTIAAPYRQKFFLPPHIGSMYTGRIAAQGCAYVFTVELLEYIDQPIQLWRTTFPSDIKRVQLRNFVRIDIILDVILEPVLKESHSGPIVTVTKDISASGIRVLMASPLPEKTILNISLPLEGGTIVHAVGQVMRIIPPEEEYHKYEMAISFTQIDEKIRGQIIKYIFRKQIERKKKEAAIFS